MNDNFNLTAVMEPRFTLTIQNEVVEVQPDFNLSLENKPLQLSVGLQGQKGDQGDVGPQGLQGPEGPIGPAGADGVSFGFDATDTLANQALYDVEAVGFRLLTSDTGEIYVRLDPTGWSAPIQLRGATGATGEQGPQGLQGIQGPQGNPGLDGEGFNIDVIDSFANLATYAAQPSGFSVVDPTTGLLYLRTDTPGEWTNGIQFVGPEGPTGPQGPQGLQGPAGVDGQNGADFAFDAIGLRFDRSLYNSQLKGFTFLATDEGNMYVRSTDAIGTWTAAIPFQGPEGPIGATGPQGSSAYQVAVDTQGFLGTEAEWLTSISAYGVAVANGYVGSQADWLLSLTPYGIALINGFVGTEAQWLESLVGPQGASAYAAAVAEGFVGTQAEWVATLDGYGIALQQGFVGTKQQWLDALVGPQGVKGDSGTQIIYGAVDPLPSDGFDGDTYINTTTNMIFYSKQAGVWPAGIPLIGPQGPQGIPGEQGLSGNGTAPFLESRKKQTFIAMAGQVTFAVQSYNTGFIDVYLNGILLVTPTDYLANDNFNVTLANPTVAGDVVTVISYAQFEVANNDHDQLPGFEPDEHINWKIPQPAPIHVDNLPQYSEFRLPSTLEALSAASIIHPYQVGETAAANIIMTQDGILARNNGAVAPLNLNPGGPLLGDGSQLTGISAAHNYLRHDDETERTFGTGEGPGMVSPSLTKEAGSAILVNISTATRNDSGSWGGMYFRMEFSVDGGTVWENLGDLGYEGNMVISGDSIEPWEFTRLMVHPPILAATQFAVRLFHRTYDGTGTVGNPAGTGGSSGVVLGTNYSIGTPQITLLEVPV